jgi:hypothetical protein
MSAADILGERASRQNWTLEDQLDVVLQYIENQGDNPCFEDYLADQAALDERTLVLPLPPAKDGEPKPA